MRFGFCLALIGAVLGRERCVGGLIGQRATNRDGSGQRWPRRKEKREGERRNRGESVRGEREKKIKIFFFLHFRVFEF